MQRFISELQRRNVLRVAAFYAGGGWLLVQVATQVFPFYELPNWTVRLVIGVVLIGFPFALVFAWFYELTPEGLKRESQVERGHSLTRATGKMLDRSIIAVLALAVVMLLADKFVLRTDGAEDGKSIAVLPFVNASGDAGNDYFSDGLSEELIAALGRLRALKVIGRTSSFQFRNRSDDSRTIGAKLGVHSLLEGNVRKDAGRVRIIVRLVNAADDRQLWTETYDRELKDIFAVQSEIADTVVARLDVALLGNEVRSAESAAPANRNVEAYTALLQGNFHALRRTTEDYRKAVAYYEEAIRLAPDYALAHAKLALIATDLATTFALPEAAAKQAMLDRASAAAGTALALGPALAEAHRAHGVILERVTLDAVGAEAEYRRAAELAPQDSAPVQAQASLKASFGQLDPAVALMRRAVALDPLRSGAQATLGLYLTALGNYDAAESAVRNAIELQPQASRDYLYLATIEILRGNPAAAVALARQETDPFWRTYALALACFANGERAEADAQLMKLIDEDADDSGSQIAEVYALRREPERMFEWLDHAWATHDTGVSELLSDPFLLAYRRDPRFVAFAQKIGVMPVTSASR